MESPLFEVGDLLCPRDDIDHMDVLMDEFTGLLIQNVCPDGENVLCEMLIIAVGRRPTVSRIWQGFLRRC